MIGQTLAHYRILEKLGAGGMGEVYRAHDDRLGRDIAIKVLPAASFSGSSARLRLKREARAAAALNHPHICVIYDVGEVGDQPYIAMELVAGRTLSSILTARPLSPQDELRYGIELADALGHAHDRGIIHRDLKSLNVIVGSDGRLKILDFGLAKLATEAASGESATQARDTVTEEGVVFGTLAYMSPEQLRGHVADARSDIWALGVMLYEMATSKLPFPGSTRFEVSASILEKDPTPLPAEVALELRAVIQRCLEKDPARRYQRAGEVRAALEAIQTGRAISKPNRRAFLASTALGLLILTLAFVIGRLNRPLWGGQRIKAVVVLPFANLSSNADEEYFVSGMHDALIKELAQIGALRVISRTSAMKYKESKKSAPEIARELNVDGIVEASVLRTADKVRIQVQLVEAVPEERHLWAQTYDRDLRDVLALHREVTQSIAREIRVELSPEQRTRLASARQVNGEAYEAYLRGMHELNRFTPEGTKKGLEYLHQAVDKDPADPRAYASLAIGYALVGHGSSGPDAFMKARAAARNALELDDTIAEAHGALAEVKAYYEWDWEGARREFERALQLNPNADEIHRHYAWLHVLQWRMDEAIRESRRAQEINPLRPVHFAEMGWLHLFIPDFDRAIVEAQKALELNPKAGNAMYVLGSAYAGKGMFEEAIATHQNLITIVPNNKFGRPGLAMTYAHAGRTQEARALLEEILNDKNPGGLHAYHVARVYAALGDNDEAFRWANIAYEKRTWGMPWVFHEATYRKLREDRRYAALMKRLNLQP